MKALFVTVTCFVMIPTFFISSGKKTYPETDRVFSIALDGIRESDVEPYLQELMDHFEHKGFSLIWKGKESNCRASQKTNVSLPAYANFFTGTVDPKIRDNDFMGKLKKDTLFDLYPNSQLFTSWEPLLRVMSNSKAIRKERGFVVFHENTPYVASDSLVAKAFDKHYNGTAFSFVHLTDADNFAHMKRGNHYKKAVAKSVELSRRMIDTVEDKHPGNNLYLLFSDHSRGSGKYWYEHGKYLPESGDIWFLIISKIPLPYVIPICDHTALHGIIKASLKVS